MISLAPIRYGKVLSADGGPIDRIDTMRLGSTDGTLYQANAYLNAGLNIQTKMDSAFRQSDGCGTHVSPMVARHKAISEALERWALYHLFHSGDHCPSGFDKDSTSTGIAAFPGLWPRQARVYAQSEAIERYCLGMWTMGNLSCERVTSKIQGVSAIGIQNPFKGFHVVVTWKQYAPDRFSYGFSAGKTLQKALMKAQVEMDRLSTALQQFHSANPGFRESDLLSIGNRLERRILNFSLLSGHRHFLSMVTSSSKTGRSAILPRPVIDRRLRGPWEQYAFVWRVLYPIPGKIYRDDARLFYW